MTRLLAVLGLVATAELGLVTPGHSSTLLEKSYYTWSSDRANVKPLFGAALETWDTAFGERNGHALTIVAATSGGHIKANASHWQDYCQGKGPGGSDFLSCTYRTDDAQNSGDVPIWFADVGWADPITTVTNANDPTNSYGPDERWGYNDANLGPTEWSMAGNMLHEVGHVFGLGHSTDTGCPNTELMEDVSDRCMANNPQSHAIRGANTWTSLGLNETNYLDNAYADWCPTARKTSLAAVLTKGCGDDEDTPPGGAALATYFVVNSDADWAEWLVEFEIGTEFYRVEGKLKEGTWVLLADVPVEPETALYNVALSSGYQEFRLVEVETYGSRNVLSHAFAPTEAKTGPRFSGQDPRTRSKAAEFRQVRATKMTDPIVIYTGAPLVQDVQNGLADYWSNRGHTVTVIDVASFGAANAAELRDDIKSDIETKAAGGTHYFHLVGDANDWDQYGGTNWQTYWPTSEWQQIRTTSATVGRPLAGQPTRDIIPTYYHQDTRPSLVGMPFYRPYSTSDLDYANTNNDSQGIPDVVVTRWPVATVAELAAMTDRLTAYNTARFSSSYVKAATMVGRYGNATGAAITAAETSAFVQDINDALPTTVVASHHEDSNYSEVNDANVVAQMDFWNLQAPDLIVMASAGSEWHRPQGMFSKFAPVNPFSTSLLNADVNPWVVALNCQTSEFDRTELDSQTTGQFESPVSEDLLHASGNKGAIAWVGTTSQMWWSSGRALSTKIVEEYTADQVAPMGELFRRAVSRLITENVGNIFVTESLRSIVFLGDPVTPLMTLPSATTTDEGVPTTSLSFRPSRNPATGPVRLALGLPARAEVEVSIYDVRGRRLQTLVSGQLPAGMNEVSWDRRDHRGAAVLAGIYLAVARIDGEKLTTKVMLAR